MSFEYDQGSAGVDGPQDCGAFFLDAFGPYAPRQLQLQWLDQPRPTMPQVEQAIEAAWTTRAGQARREGWNLFDGRLCRLIEYHANRERLSLTLGPTHYRDFVGTNLHNAYLRYVHGPEVLANPLGVSAVVVVGNEYILLGRRSAAVAYHAGRIHPVGGCVEPASDGNPPDPFATLREELHEELGLTGAVGDPVTCLGLIRDKHIVQPELIFDVPVQADVEEIRRRVDGSVGGEHTALEVVHNHPASVVRYIEAHFAQLTPVCLGGLLLHGLYCWGSGWFATTRGYLRSLI